MKIVRILLWLSLWLAVASGQYELRETYYGPGGPVGATGGSYELWGSALSQTAVTTVTGGTFENQQGFYHGEKMFFVRFFAKDVQRAANGEADSITLWADTLKVVVHYLNRGIWRTDTIGKDGNTYIDVWVDTVQSGYNYWYEPLVVFQSAAATCLAGAACDPNFHRWARPDTAWGTVVQGTQDDAETVTVSFWEQYRCSVYVEYDPPDLNPSPPPTYDGGLVDFVSYRQFGTVNTEDDAYEHNDTFDTWCDAGNASYSSKLQFSDTTTAGWITLNDHVFGDVGGLDKSIIKTIKYQKPYSATYAQAILWRRYTLFGVPLYPREDTTKYINFASTHGCGDFSGLVDYGEQDIVLYDDMHTTCTGTDSNCGTWESWYRIMRYYPDVGGYKRYQGPGDPDNPDRFAPGIGFWGNQTHCDSLLFDTWGVLADTTEGFEVGLHRYDGTNSYTRYNMLANPFYNPSDDTIKVDVTQWQIKNVNTSTTVDIAQAVANGWIQNPIWVYRRSGSSWAYVPLDITTANTDKYINEWEGFWIIVAPTCTDSLVLIMYTERTSPVSGLLRAARGGTEWFVKLSCSADDELDLENLAGYCSQMEKKMVEPSELMNPPDMPNKLHLYYLIDGEKLAGYFFNSVQDVYHWKVHLEPGEKQGKDFRLFWDISTVPPQYAVKLKIPGVGDIDLKTSNEITLNALQKPLDMDLYVYAVSSEIAQTEGLVPNKFFITNAIPNPFNTSARIEFGIPAGKGDRVIVEILDISGHKIKTLWDKVTSPGYYSVVWDGTDDSGKPVPAENYLCRLIHPQFHKTTHAVLIK